MLFAPAGTEKAKTEPTKTAPSASMAVLVYVISSSTFYFAILEAKLTLANRAGQG